MIQRTKWLFEISSMPTEIYKIQHQRFINEAIESFSIKYPSICIHEYRAIVRKLS